ncbi:gephyrin-like molybdotransferase Glp [Paracoccus pacificus]|uniref:Molybdopterin molybdenumtransferase n=1 Tax=Paracoccus pacificus TaxID=1463598 RepID=A0ABW4R2E1_9RHOB
MISVAEALARVLSLAPPPQAEEVPLDQAAGRVLARDVAARLTQPPFDSASMDGYAIRAADLGRGPLRVVGEAAAGRGWTGTAGAGEAVRIFTGAPVPDGFDRVVMQEQVSRDGDLITVHDDASQKSNIRPQGIDFAAGHAVTAGTFLTARHIGLLAAMNIDRVPVARRPRVAILAGGDELVPPGTPPGPGQIISSNDLAIAALVAEAGGLPQRLPIARDTSESLRESLAAAEGSDLIVTIGGASVGDHDLVAPVAAALGMRQEFYKIRMRPGKPLMAGRLAKAAMIGLPGNPVSAMVCAMIFMQPLIRAMQGLRRDDEPLRARLATELPPEGDRQHYLRARLAPGPDLPLIRPADDQDSSLQSVLAASDALLIRPAGDPARKPGEIVEFIPLGR